MKLKKYFGQNTSFETLHIKMTFTKHIANMSQGLPNPGFRSNLGSYEYLASLESKIRYCPFYIFINVKKTVCLRLKLNLPRIDIAIPITMSKAPMVTALHACHKQVDVTWPSALNVENKGLAEGPLSPCPIKVNQN